jgi:hypothetical protein
LSNNSAMRNGNILLTLRLTDQVFSLTPLLLPQTRMTLQLNFAGQRHIKV